MSIEINLYGILINFYNLTFHWPPKRLQHYYSVTNLKDISNYTATAQILDTSFKRYLMTKLFFLNWYTFEYDNI